MTPNMTARTGFQKETWFGLVHISLAGVRCGCVELAESAAAEPRFPVENKPHEAKHQVRFKRTHLHFTS